MFKQIFLIFILGLFNLPLVQGADIEKTTESNAGNFILSESTTRSSTIHTSIDTLWQIQMGRSSVEMKKNRENNRTRLRMVLVPVDKFRGHWGGVELGFNNYSSSKLGSTLSDDSFMHLNAQKSMVVGLNLLPYSVDLHKGGNNFGLVTGMGLTIHNYRLDSQNILKRDNNGHTHYDVAVRPVSKNKITSTYLTIPLLFEIQFPASNKNRLYISGGFYGGFKLGSHTKVMYNDHLENSKVKSREDLNINPFRYGATFRAGYGIIQIFATADLSPMFQSGYGPELYPWSIGLSLITF